MAGAVGFSTCVFQADYNEETQELTIEFQKRGTYRYTDVPPEIYADLEAASSQGQYFNDNIKNQFNYTRIA